MSVFLAVSNLRDLTSEDLAAAVRQLYAAFHSSGCRIVVGTPGGLGLSEHAELPKAFVFPVDLAEVEARHLAHYDLVCVVAGEGERRHIVCTPPTGTLLEAATQGTTHPLEPTMAEADYHTLVQRVRRRADKKTA